MYKIIHDHVSTGLRGKALKHQRTPAGDQVTIETHQGKKFTALKEEFNICVEITINFVLYRKVLTTAKNVKHSFFSRVRIAALSLIKKEEYTPDSPVSIGLAYIINEYIKIAYKTSELNRKQRDQVTLAFKRNFNVVGV